MYRKNGNSNPAGSALLLWTVLWVLAAPGTMKGQDPTAASEAPTSSANPQNTCLVCHANLGGRLSAPTTPFPADVHIERGLTCASCHGGDPTSMDPKVAMGAASGWRGKPSRTQVPEFCGRCHSDTAYMHQFRPDVQTDQTRQYFTSQHGKLLQQGDSRVATCINCHSVHDIKRVSDPSSPVYPLNIPATCGSCHSNEQYMAGFSLPSLTQEADYKTSAHYQALTAEGNLSAPTCVTCHSSHGATPPGVQSITEVCGTCHTHNREFFEASPHQAIFEGLGIAGCVQCHGNHAVQRTGEQMLSGPNSVCMGCHSSGDAGSERAEAMAGRIRELDETIQRARGVLDQADRAGMDVSSAASDLTTAHSHLIMARTAIHSLDIDKVNAEVENGIPVAEAAAQIGRDRLDEVQSRRKGVALFSLLVLVIVLTLYLYIRQDEGAAPSDNEAAPR